MRADGGAPALYDPMAGRHGQAADVVQAARSARYGPHRRPQHRARGCWIPRLLTIGPRACLHTRVPSCSSMRKLHQQLEPREHMPPAAHASVLGDTGRAHRSFTMHHNGWTMQSHTMQMQSLGQPASRAACVCPLLQMCCLPQRCATAHPCLLGVSMHRLHTPRSTNTLIGMTVKADNTS
jgi:hypothetical protein